MAVCDFRSTRCGNVWLLMDFVFPLLADSPAQAYGVCRGLRTSRHVVKHVGQPGSSVARALVGF